VSANLSVSGNFTVAGNVTAVDSTITNIKDNVITLNKGETGSGVTLNVSGIEIDRGDLARQRLIWTESLGKWLAGPTSSEVALATETFVNTGLLGKANTGSLGGTLTANIAGAGYSITDVNSYSGNTISISGNVTGGNIITSGTGGNITGANNYMSNNNNLISN
jgi:hypothetical protein